MQLEQVLKTKLHVVGFISIVNGFEQVRMDIHILFDAPQRKYILRREI